MWWWATARKLGTCSSGLLHVRGLLLGQYWQKTFVNVFNTYTNIFSSSPGFSTVQNLRTRMALSRHSLTHPVPYTLAHSSKNLFLPGFTSSPGWLLVTRTRGAWWCRYRGHCRSGPRHLSPRSWVCAQEWHCKDIHSHIHSHPPLHTPKINEEQNPQLTKHDAFV